MVSIPVETENEIAADEPVSSLLWLDLFSTLMANIHEINTLLVIEQYYNYKSIGLLLNKNATISQA